MHPLILILGPTAGSKTTFSIELANTLEGGGECIIADSMQVYRSMNIGTAKPSEEEQTQAVHHLIDVAEPSEDGFTVDVWLQKATSSITDIRKRGRWPIIVGGTNLYVQSLLYGLFDGPKSDPMRRIELQKENNTALHKTLQTLDHASAERIHINDTKRLIRAIEVCELTGKQLSELQTQWEASKPRQDAILIGLTWPVDVINKRINARVKQMIEDGFLEEVQELQAVLGPQAREALGYKQLLMHLEGHCTLEEAIEKIKILTRRFAKQQRSWLRRFQVLPNAHFINMENKKVQDAVNEAVMFILAAKTATKAT